ncbi:MAG TPA: hypothetical protein VFS20_21985 [Longimicrobium sp.]|nr:hypothetical protein [Longimicrobium sp.]
MLRTGFLAMALALALSAGAAACDGAGGHNNADENKEGGDAGAPIGGPEAGAAGTQITPGPPPVGTVNPVPPDTNTAISTPATAPASDTGRHPEGNHPGASRGGQQQDDS